MTARELKLDYFKIYDVVNRKAAVRVALQGQFDRQPDAVQLTELDYFASVASKNGEAVYDKHAHLTWYRTYRRAPDPTRLVVAQDQFGQHEFLTGNLFGILAPAQKAVPGSVFPKALDHYKVYWALQHKMISKKAKLKDQFAGDEVTVMVPYFFAVPASKLHHRTTVGIQNRRAHLLIYSITSRAQRRAVRVRDQFGRYPLEIVRSVALAAPCLKLRWKKV